MISQFKPHTYKPKLIFIQVRSIGIYFKWGKKQKIKEEKDINEK